MLEPLAILDGNLWVKALTIVGIVFAAYVLVLWVASMLWVYRDAQSRTFDARIQTAAVMLVGLFNVPGFLLYLAIRPQDTLADAYNRRLEAEAFLHEIEREELCATCRRPVAPAFVACPHCRAQLHEPCVSCGRNLRSGWTLCPYCASERRPAAPRPRVASAAVAVKHATAPRDDTVSQPRPAAHQAI